MLATVPTFTSTNIGVAVIIEPPGQVKLQRNQVSANNPADVYTRILLVPAAGVHGPLDEGALSHKKVAPGTYTSVVRAIVLPWQRIGLLPDTVTVVAADGDVTLVITAFPVFDTQVGSAWLRTQIGYVPAANPLITLEDCQVPSVPFVLFELKSYALFKLL